MMRASRPAGRPCTAQSASCHVRTASIAKVQTLAGLTVTATVPAAINSLWLLFQRPCKVNLILLPVMQRITAPL